MRSGIKLIFYYNNFNYRLRVKCELEWRDLLKGELSLLAKSRVNGLVESQFIAENIRYLYNLIQIITHSAERTKTVRDVKQL